MVQDLCSGPPTEEEVFGKLEKRLGRVYARLRLGIEQDHEAQIFGQGINFFHPENWYAIHSVIRGLLKLTGLYWLGRKNAGRVHLRHNDIQLPDHPPRFDGFTILQISDLHVDMNPHAIQRVIELLPDLKYDACVLTGDYRGPSVGPIDTALGVCPSIPLRPADCA